MGIQKQDTIFLRRVFGEPVRRPDGTVVSVYEREHGKFEVNTTEGAAIYSAAEVGAMGTGDVVKGAIRIGQEHYRNSVLSEAQTTVRGKIGEMRPRGKGIEG